MIEKEKMLRGELYNSSSDKDLVEDRGVNRIKRHSAQSQNGALLWITETYPHS